MIDSEKEEQDLKNALLKANEEIEKLSRIKSDFISIVSHELRTPLTSIKESVSLVLDGIAGPLSEEQKKIITITKNNIDRLTKLITDILDLSKLEAGRVMMHKRKLDINGIIKEVCAVMKIEAEKKNLELSFSLGEPLELTWLDPDRIAQVLKNIILNAIKFNRINGRVKILSSKENIKGRDFIKVIVEDNGIGIPQEDMENLFRHFGPLDTSMTRKYSGAGLGLVISKGIIGLHGGDIWVVSEPDISTQVIFTIPVYKKHEEFDFLMLEAIESAKQNDAKISLIVFETKDLKDRVEKVFIDIENIMKGTVRGPEDKVSRYEKLESIAIIARTDRPGSAAIIKRLEGSINVPLFFGVSVYPDEAVDKEELMKNAEEDLKSGRNSVIPH